MEIGATIKRRREKADVTRAELAARCEGPGGAMRRQQLVRIESDLSSPTLRTLERVATALGCTVWQLVKEAENG